MPQVKAWFKHKCLKLIFLVPAISLKPKNSRVLKVVKTKTSTSKTKTLFFVLEAPQDQDFGLDDYITVNLSKRSAGIITTYGVVRKSKSIPRIVYSCFKSY